MKTTKSLTDTDGMPFGMYMRTPLRDVPTQHLHWVSTQPRVMKHYPALAAYIAGSARVIAYHQGKQAEVKPGNF